MMEIGRLLPGARGLLRWSLSDLQKYSGVNSQTIHNLEKGEVKPHTETVQKLVNAIQKAGVKFTETGAEFITDKITHLEGKGWFVKLLDDVYETLKDENEKELLIFGGDNRVSPPEVVEKFRKLRESGVIIREMVEDENTYLMGDVKYYRWIPQKFFKNFITIIYKDKVCNDFGGRALLIQNPDWAATERNKFELIWHVLPELNVESTSNVRY